MSRFRLLLAAGVALFGVSGAARASLITTPTQTITFNSQLTDWSRSGTFGLFDSGLGTLVSITVSSAYSETSTVTVTNNSTGNNPAGPSTGNARTDSVLTLSSPTAGINSVIQALLHDSGSPAGENDALGAKFFFTALAAGQSVSGSSDATSTLAAVTDSTAADLVPFQAAGGGTATLNASTFTSSSITFNGGNSAAAQTTLGSGNFTIAYTYSVPDVVGVPEPASMVLLGAGLLGAGLMRRRSK